MYQPPSLRSWRVRPVLYGSAAASHTLRATAANGTTTAHIFESTAGSGVVSVGEPTAFITATTGSGAIDGTLVTLIVLALLVGGIGGAAFYVYQQLRHPRSDPGMAAGEDPIWAGATGETQ